MLVALGDRGEPGAALRGHRPPGLYDDPIVFIERTKYQEIVLTQALTADDLRLFLNGDLQFSSRDEYRYHEALVHPAMAGPHARVLVLGGGDGLALREVLRHAGVRRVVDVELDRGMTRLARDDERLRALNGRALRRPARAGRRPPTRSAGCATPASASTW